MEASGSDRSRARLSPAPSDAAPSQAGGAPVRPRFSFKRREVDGAFVVSPVECVVTESYRLFKQREIIADLKEAVCRVLESPLNEQEMATIPSSPYELPDGKVLEVGVERYKVPELLFNPAMLASLPVPPELLGKEESLKGLTAMANESINKCDIDLKKDFLLGVLVTVRPPLLSSPSRRQWQPCARAFLSVHGSSAAATLSSIVWSAECEVRLMRCAVGLPLRRAARRSCLG